MSPATPEVGSSRKSGASRCAGLPNGNRTDIYTPARSGMASLPRHLSPLTCFCDTMRPGSARRDRIFLSVKRQEVAGGGHVQDRRRSNLLVAQSVFGAPLSDRNHTMAAVNFQFGNIGRRCRATSPSCGRACPRRVPETMDPGTPGRARDAARFRLPVQELH